MPEPAGTETAPPPRTPIVPGALYVVATPIGNLGDVSERAREVLAGVDRIACEDTRTSLPLLQHLGVRRPLQSYHEHNEREAAESLADRVAGGESLALISDAGTPTLSDPGFRLVRACRRRGLPVIPIPGPCAAIAALAASGLPSDAFLFSGFLPARTAARRRYLEEHRTFPHTLLLYESCHRIEALAEEIEEVLGPGRTVALAKELTKRHERFLVGPIAGVRVTLASVSAKGEWVVVIAPEGFVL